MTALATARSMLVRYFSRLLFLIALLLTSATPRVAGADVPNDEPVRTGRTELGGPVAGAEPPAADPALEHTTAPPVDAPRVRPGQIRLPAVASGFGTYDGGWIRFTFHPSVRERIEPLIAEADRVRRDLTDRLGQPVLKNVRVDIARTAGEMETLAPVGAPYPAYAEGVAYSGLGLVLLTLNPRHANPNYDLAQVFRHELAHVALHDAVGDRAVPRWFNEGFAVLASGETSFDRMWELYTATLSDRLIPLSEVERSFPSDESKVSIAYAQAVDVVRFLVRNQEAHRFRSLIQHLREGHDLDQATRHAYAIDLKTLEHEWREDVAKRYTFWPVLFSGTAVWAFALVLFGLAWRKRRKRARATLDRWARDEAREDALRRLRDDGRVHIVLAPSPQVVQTPLPHPVPEPVEVPRVQHDGEWHTLH
jgi:hypothetical protein